MIRSNQHQTARANGAAPAALPGGAQAIGGRGCGLVGWLSPVVSMSVLATAALLLLTVQAVRAVRADEPGLTGAFVPVTVPSGQQVLLSEVLLDETPGALWARFRFVAPAISRLGALSDGAGAAMDFQRSAADMEHLCDSLALDYLRKHELAASMVVISFSDRPVEFGTADPEATQFFEAYRPDDGGCIWEAF